MKQDKANFEREDGETVLTMLTRTMTELDYNGQFWAVLHSQSDRLSENFVWGKSSYDRCEVTPLAELEQRKENIKIEQFYLSFGPM